MIACGLQSCALLCHTGMRNNVFVKLDPDLESKVKLIDIPYEDLQVTLSDSIGQGNFGLIYLGQLRQGEAITTVAVKLLKGSFSLMQLVITTRFSVQVSQKICFLQVVIL